MSSQVLDKPRAGLPLLLSRKQIQLPPEEISIRHEFDPSIDGCRELVMDNGRTLEYDRRSSSFANIKGTTGNVYTTSTTAPTGQSDDTANDPNNDLSDEL